MAVHHAIGISRQKNSGYRPSRVNIVAQGFSTPNPSLNPTHLSIRRGRATTTHYTHHQVSLVVSRNTTLVPSLGLRIGPACEAGLSAGMRRERVSPQIRKKRRKKGEKCQDMFTCFDRIHERDGRIVIHRTFLLRPVYSVTTQLNWTSR